MNENCGMATLYIRNSDSPIQYKKSLFKDTWGIIYGFYATSSPKPVPDSPSGKGVKAVPCFYVTRE